MLETSKEFQKELKRKLNTHSTFSHPLFDELAKSRNSIGLLKTVSLEGYHLVKMFPRYIAALLHNCPIDKFRSLLATNLYEEETGGLSNTAPHLKLMQKFLESIGITEKEIERAHPLPTTKDLIDYRWNLVITAETFHLGAAAVTIASEGQNLEKKSGKFKHEVLQEVYGLKDKDVKFFSMHVTEDEDHVTEGIQIVSETCKDFKMQQAALEVIDETYRKFWNFYDGVYESYRLKS